MSAYVHPHACVHTCTMYTYTQTCINTYTYICTCTHARIHAHTYTYACICTPIHSLGYKISATTPQCLKQYHRRTYVSICICMHIHIHMYIHIWAHSAASELQMYVNVKKNICVTHTCTCTGVQTLEQLFQSARNTHCKKMHIYIYIRAHTASSKATRLFLRSNTSNINQIHT